ncbi:thyrotroph embryonic factor-like isoform X2 [Microplitis mediator]|uniref:thyrotroph embryonic factor-like isoform X2 n=1 Tax=Microplitis mediator TaxID=375433 RepID=UPI002552BB95|nr:thyrotroph embryonic factor-like isoform X2 [Microplitis mediator]
MSEAEAGASWQQYAWDMTYPNHHPQQQLAQYQPQYQHHASTAAAYPQHHHQPLHLQESHQGTSSQEQQMLAQHHHHHHHHHHNPQGQPHHQYEDHAEAHVRRQNLYNGSAGDPMITSSLKGKQNKDGPEEKKDADGELWGNVEAQAAFLGPNLWDKTLPYDADLKVLNHYVDLDEFLSENGIPVDGVGGGVQGTMQPGQLHKLNNANEAASHQGPAGLHLEPVTKRERSPSPSDCCSPDTLNPPSPADSTLSMASSGRDFDPRTRAFSDEELKPQPMIKKSRKQFVPDDLKDDKYWARRRKNNMAAKRSRDARRMKENQIALRAGFLEKENMGLRQELDRLKNENMLLRDKLSKYTDV